MRNNKKVKLKGNATAYASLFLLVIIVASLGYSGIKLFQKLHMNNFVAKLVNGTNVSFEEDAQVEPITINIAAIGDIMSHSQNYKDAYNNATGTYDFSHVFTNIKDYIKDADISVGNLETTFSGASRGFSGYPLFNTPEQLGKALSDIGLDVVTTANNHSLDRSYSGLESTLNFLDSFGLEHTGTARSQEEQNTIVIKDVSGIKVAFLTYTYGTNGIPVPSGRAYCVNLIDKNLMKQHISSAKEQGAELICVSMHWGNEYQTYENSTQRELATFLFENGVDIIFGSHAHVLQPMEKRQITLEDGTVKNVFVVYSLGNFMSGQYFPNTKSTAIVNVQATKDETGNVKLDKVTYVPLYLNSVNFRQYKLIDIRKAITAYENGTDTSIGSSLYNTLKTELNSIEKILGPEIEF